MDIKEIYNAGYNTSHDVGIQNVYDAGYAQGVKDATTPMPVSMDQVSTYSDPVTSSGSNMEVEPVLLESLSDPDRPAPVVIPVSGEQMEVKEIPHEVLDISPSTTDTTTEQTSTQE